MWLGVGYYNFRSCPFIPKDVVGRQVVGSSTRAMGKGSSQSLKKEIHSPSLVDELLLESGL